MRWAIATVTCAGWLLAASANAQPGADAQPEPGAPLPPLPPDPPSAPSAPSSASSAGKPDTGQALKIVAASPTATPAGSKPPCACTHDGFYLAISSGPAYGGVWGPGPNGPASISGVGFTSKIAVGGTIAPGLVLAGTIALATTSATFHGGPTITATEQTVANGTATTSTTALTGGGGDLVVLGALVDWFPAPSAGWHAGAYAGLGVVGFSDAVGNAVDGTTLGGGVSGGYQWWLGRKWSLGLQLALSGAARVKQSDSNNADSGYRLGGGWLGVESVLLYY